MVRSPAAGGSNENLPSPSVEVCRSAPDATRAVTSAPPITPPPVSRTTPVIGATAGAALPCAAGSADGPGARRNETSKSATEPVIGAVLHTRYGRFRQFV